MEYIPVLVIMLMLVQPTICDGILVDSFTRQYRADNVSFTGDYMIPINVYRNISREDVSCVGTMISNISYEINMDGQDFDLDLFGISCTSYCQGVIGPFRQPSSDNINGIHIISQTNGTISYHVNVTYAHVMYSKNNIYCWKTRHSITQIIIIIMFTTFGIVMLVMAGIRFYYFYRRYRFRKSISEMVNYGSTENA